MKRRDMGLPLHSGHPSLERFETVVITPPLIEDAIDCSIINRISFWDALIVVAAESAHCERLWSEDLSDGQVIRGVRIENPLVSAQTRAAPVRWPWDGRSASQEDAGRGF